MIKFSLAKLQQNSPYELFYSDGDFSFVTDNGLHYSVSFSEESSLGNCDTYQLIIRRIDKDYNGYDSKVEKQYCPSSMSFSSLIFMSCYIFVIQVIIEKGCVIDCS